jgi:hypothetical protein
MRAASSRISAALPQRRNLQDHHRQAVVEVRAETPLRDARTQVRRRGGDELHIQLALGDRPQTAHALLFEGTQQFGLQRQRQCVGLVQEQRAVRRALQKASFSPSGVGEGASLEAEQLHLQQGLRDSGAVDVHERALGARTALVDDPGDQAFAGPGFALQQ